MIIKLNDDKIKLKKLRLEADEQNKLLKDIIKKLNDPNKRYCERCNIIIHRASYAKHLKSKKHLQDQTKGPLDQKDFINQPSTSKYNPKSLKELARDKIKLDNKDLNKEIAKKCLILIILKIKIYIMF